MRNLLSTFDLVRPRLGIVEGFRPGEYERVEKVLADLKALGVTEFRTGFSWADWQSDAGEEWYSWLIPRLALELNLLLCFHCTPPALGLLPKTSSPPRDSHAFTAFLDQVIHRFGKYFERVELWNEPNNLTLWDWRMDPEWTIFCQMIREAAQLAQQRGKETVLGGTNPTDPNWLRLIAERGVLDHVDVVGVHGFPGTWEFDWERWQEPIGKVQEVLESRAVKPAIWVTETGFSTWRHDEHRQLCHFVKALEAPVERVYWYGAYDLHPDLPTREGFHTDDRHYHMGMKRADGTPKLLYRLWATGGLAAVRAAADVNRGSPRKQKKDRSVLITGGAGFIGTNLAHRLAKSGQTVRVFDNLSRAGVEQNLHWLRHQHGDGIQVEVADVRDRFALRRALAGVKQVFHFAAQVAVTTSLLDPLHDSEINMRGTLNLLEELRALHNPPPLLFTSTNKVYGKLAGLELHRHGTRYTPENAAVKEHGIGEDCPLDFHSPYGCSKGAADQCVLDYARTFGLTALVFRMSCIYGLHQFGTEDQGWVAHFLMRTLDGEPITLYGDGRQVRDILYVDDLVEAFLLAQENIRTLSGQVFNMGGGPENAVSLIELLDLIKEVHGEKPSVRLEDWRPGDQRYYVSDTRKFQAATGWAARVGAARGVRKLYNWLLRTREVPSVRVVARKGVA